MQNNFSFLLFQISQNCGFFHPTRSLFLSNGTVFFKPKLMQSPCEILMYEELFWLRQEVFLPYSPGTPGTQLSIYLTLTGECHCCSQLQTWGFNRFPSQFNTRRTQNNPSPFSFKILGSSRHGPGSD